MNTEQQKKVKDFFDAGFAVIIVKGDSNTVLLDITEIIGVFVYTTETLDDEPLGSINFEEIEIYRKIENFMVLDPQAIK